MKRLSPLFIVGALLALTTSTQAGLFSISCTGANCSNAAVAQLINVAETDVNSQLPDADASTYLKGMANSSVMANKGATSDYANDVDVFLIGVGAGIGADVGNNSFGDLISGDIDGNQLRGFGVQPSLLVGINLGLWDMPTIFDVIDLNKMKVFISFFKFDVDQTKIDANVTNFGLHLRYKLQDPVGLVPGRLVYWTGVDITTGFEYSNMDVTVTESKSQAYTVAPFTLNMAGTISLGAKVSTMTIPLEISTGIQLGYIFTLYGGLGADLNFGKAEAKASAVAPITGVPSADLVGSINLGQDSSPATFLPRGFAGVQINVPFVKLYVHLDRAFTEDAYGAGVGLKVTY
jgi:hypothetical protein